MINLAIDNGGIYEDEWKEAWHTFEEAANTRSSRITSNLISLCRYSLAIADHLERVGIAITNHHELIFSKEKYLDNELKNICRTSIHWMGYLTSNGPDKTREMIHKFLIEQKEFKPIHSKNLRTFTKKVIDLLNSKYKHLKIIFEIEK